MLAYIVLYKKNKGIDHLLMVNTFMVRIIHTIETYIYSINSLFSAVADFMSSVRLFIP